MAKSSKNGQRLRWIISITLWTFVLAVILGFVSYIFFTRYTSLLPALLILFLVIFMGIAFDLVGTAAAAASEVPLNAKASRKVPGARRAVYLVKHADQVANFCNDVVGDISGIVSGTITALIVVKLVAAFPGLSELALGIILTALVAALTVGGKAWGKAIAINYCTDIILLVGKIITKLESPFDSMALRRRDSR
ncbi:MAG TPA: hypothetical protein PKO38_06110 [Bacillota bacterium]|jgi:CBS domain containing-hemolysin-like protein|nr:hypothetical protein [Bacillota bacterium]HOB87243.1 hypothetical protein [Bacillota bacterium]HOP68957.1 hypothetical protein [Bacillota bacterium]HPT33895.1 hypothetical protein [Bacillota bacterium]HPZ64576.1 hypothetical protein [Bacillota bacterium]